VPVTVRLFNTKDLIPAFIMNKIVTDTLELTANTPVAVLQLIYSNINYPFTTIK